MLPALEKHVGCTRRTGGWRLPEVKTRVRADIICTDHDIGLASSSSKDVLNYHKLCEKSVQLVTGHGWSLRRPIYALTSIYAMKILRREKRERSRGMRKA